MSASVPLSRGHAGRAVVADRIATGVMWGLGAFVLLVLGGIILHFLLATASFMSIQFLLNNPDMLVYGVGPYLWNSVYTLLLTMLISTPIGVLGGIYMAEYAGENAVTSAIRFAQEAVSSVPSIVVGLFGYGLLATSMHGFNILAGALALTVFNLPLMTRLTEQAIRAVPQDERSASLALGATKWQTIRHVVLPLAISGIVTGIILTAGRAFGEAAVLLFTSGQTATPGFSFTNFDILSQASAWSPFRFGGTLSTFIWYARTSANGVANIGELANGAAMVLIAIVLLFNVGARLLSRLLTRRFTAA